NRKRVRRDGREDYGVERWSNEWSSRGQAVCGRASRRRDDDSVTVVVAERFAIHYNAHAQHPGEAALVHHDVVERLPFFHRSSVAVLRFTAQRHALVDVVISGNGCLQRGFEIRCGAAREEAQSSQIDAENGYRCTIEKARGAEQRAVAAEG